MNLRVDTVSTRSSLSKCTTILVQVFLALIFSLVFVTAAFSQNDFSLAPGVFINEVLANEPGSNTKLEWVELHNADSVEHDMEGWAFICKDDTTWIPAGTVIPARGFLILARKLSSDPPDSISFEGWWGDRSSTWGDSPDESFPAIEAKMSLTNSGGTISLLDLESNAQTFTWDEDCGDGVSMERVSANEDIWLCCVDSDRSTPGRKNSVSTTYSEGIELSIEPNPFSPDGDGFEDQAVFRYTLPMESNLTIRIYDVKGRLIKTLVDDEPKVSGEILWDGKDDENRTVRIGIYVVLAEATGDSYSEKKATVVVAKR
ncbi:MAG: lamin tail domain-containing protein [Candidatus Zixiibacteriota bacterium]